MLQSLFALDNMQITRELVHCLSVTNLTWSAQHLVRLQRTIESKKANAAT